MSIKIKGILLNDSLDWQDLAISELKKSGLIVLSNNIEFSENTLNQLKTNSTFDIYYLNGYSAFYKAQVIDFAVNQIELTDKNWFFKYKSIAWYKQKFENYIRVNGYAKIIFLANEIKKIDKPIQFQNFVLKHTYNAKYINTIIDIKTEKNQIIDKINTDNLEIKINDILKNDIIDKKNDVSQNSKLLETNNISKKNQEIEINPKVINEDLNLKSKDKKLKTEKINSIIFKKNYLQFKKDFKIDLTYPKGHEKEGKPLEKVCIIGQSGTGKTTLLKILKSYVFGDKVSENYEINTNFLDKTALPYSIYFSVSSIDNLKALNADDIIDFDNDGVNDFYDFENSDPKQHWYSILQEVKNYQKKSIDFNLLLIDKVQNGEVVNINLELKNWAEANQNPLIYLNNFLKPMLERLFLKIKENPKKVDDLKFIPIEGTNLTHSDSLIPIEFLSSGTKQILVKTVPLYYLKPENTIIFMDEPENSLYPDVQKDFVNFVTQETWHKEKNCQFFFATHSPTIASIFEPWEVVELKFNKKDGKVEQELYYTGERHVDNYFLHPKFLRWDDILTKVFDLNSEGNEERNKALVRLSILKREIELGEATSEEKEEYLKLSKLLGWKL